MRSKIIRLHQRLTPLLVFLPLLLVGCEQWGHLANREHHGARVNPAGYVVWTISERGICEIG